MSDVIGTVLWGVLWLAIGAVLGMAFVVLRREWARRRAARSMALRHQRIEAIEAERNAELRRPTVPLPRAGAAHAADERRAAADAAAMTRRARVKPAGR